MKKSNLGLAVCVLLVVAGAATAQNAVAVTNAAAMDGTNFGLELQFAAGQQNIAFVQDQSPNGEKTYRVAFWVNMNNAAMASPSIVYLFQAHTDTPGGGPPPIRPSIRFRVLHNSGQYAAQAVTWDNQNNPRGSGGCLVPAADPFRVQIEYVAANASDPGGPGSIKMTLTDGSGSNICTKENASIQNGFLNVQRQSILTLPNTPGTFVAPSTIYIDEFESFRTLSP